MTVATVHLVACTKSKRAGKCPARDLYCASDWFAKARAYVERQGGPWFILSAEHGVVHPDAILEPYQTTLIGQPVANRRRWAARVVDQLEARGLTPAGVRFVFLAGRLYRDQLVDQLGGRELTSAPMAGLGLGEQKAWLAAQLQTNEGNDQ